MEIGAKDALGRVLKVIRNRLVLVRSEQLLARAVCHSDKEPGTPCGWVLEGKTAMGVGAQHAASKCHRVTVTREIRTEYDGEEPNRQPGA